MIIFPRRTAVPSFLPSGRSREGHAGNRGYLFNFTADFIDELRNLGSRRAALGCWSRMSR